MRNQKYIALLAALSLAACKKAETQDDAPQAFVMNDKMFHECTFADAKLENARNQIRLFGKVSAENNRLAQVFPAVGGNVIAIRAELGDYVTQGQILATLRSSEVADLQRQANDADADLAIAEKNYQTASDLYEGKLASEKDLVQAKKELDKAKAEKARTGEVHNIYHLQNGSTYNLYAPISGYVVSKDISPNEMLSASRDNSVFSIAKLDQVWVLANVNESDLGSVKPGQPVSIRTLAYPDKVIKGSIDKIFSVIDPETKAAKALIKVENPDVSLKPEMNATVTVSYPEAAQYVAIPSSAVVFDNSKNYVMVFRDKAHIETREVEIYRALDDVTYISSGLKPGEKVIDKGNLLIYDAIND
jgi:cobalt-zinc-cadmium efflux system membrane fusion protein